jgi:hypothetical protein
VWSGGGRLITLHIFGSCLCRFCQFGLRFFQMYGTWNKFRTILGVKMSWPIKKSLKMAQNMYRDIKNHLWFWKCMSLFFFVGKTHNEAFWGIFREGLNLFDPKISLHYAQNQRYIHKNWYAASLLIACC